MNFSRFQMYMLEKGALRCADVEKLYGDLYDGELPPSLRSRVSSHVEECEHCTEFARTYQLTVRLAAELGSREESIPRDVQQRLRQKLNERLGLHL